MQEENERLAREAAESASQVPRLQAEAKAALQDAQEALAREKDVQQLLQAADRVRLFCQGPCRSGPGIAVAGVMPCSGPLQRGDKRILVACWVRRPMRSWGLRWTT